MPGAVSCIRRTLYREVAAHEAEVAHVDAVAVKLGRDARLVAVELLCLSVRGHQYEGLERVTRATRSALTFLLSSSCEKRRRYVAQQSPLGRKRHFALLTANAFSDARLPEQARRRADGMNGRYARACNVNVQGVGGGVDLAVVVARVHPAEAGVGVR